MIDEVLNNTVTETESTVESTETVENPVETKTYSEEDLKKACQSSASKAKYELLKELNIKSVDEFKDIRSKYENTVKESDDLKAQLQQTRDDFDTYKLDIKIRDLGVSDEFKDEFLTLTNSKISAEVDFDAAAKLVLDKNPNYRVHREETVKIGVEKQEVKEQPNISEDLKKKYSWLH